MREYYHSLFTLEHCGPDGCIECSGSHDGLHARHPSTVIGRAAHRRCLLRLRAKR